MAENAILWSCFTISRKWAEIGALAATIAAKIALATAAIGSAEGAIAGAATTGVISKSIALLCFVAF
jgi:hypothetical protein